jgi:Zn-dependent metalloprotease
MTTIRRSSLFTLIGALAAALLFSGRAVGGEMTPRIEDPAAAERLEAFRRETRGQFEWRVSRETGNINSLRATGDALLAVDDATAQPEARALSFLEAHGEALGIRTAGRDGEGWRRQSLSRVDGFEVERTYRDELGQTHVRLNQTYRGIPVFGAQLVVHMNDVGIKGVNGAFVPGISLEPTASLPENAAQGIALAEAAQALKRAGLTASKPRLFVYRSGLLEGFAGANLLTWAVEVSGPAIRELVFVNAQTGAFLQRVSLRPEAKNRIIYSPEYNPLFVQRTESGPPSLIPGVNNLFDFAGQTYDFFFRGFNRDSYDGAGHVMESVLLINDICPNAYWDGTTTNYCPTFDVDDVVAHEWGHAYTQFTHDLIYSYQSGALNESYSDIWGETVDLTNGVDGAGGSNNSQPAPAGQRWLVGEDVPVLNQPAIGILRDMWDPTRFGDPDKVSSTRYACSADDGGGVHTNSGVSNHAFAMLVDGKTFNGQTVQGIGFVKAAHTYYRAMTVYQTPTTSFAQHADALETSCEDLRLAGTNLNDFLTGLPSGQIINVSDCAQLAKAMLAVEMRTEPTQCNFQPILDPNAPAVCSGAVNVFVEDWESGMDGWTLTSNGVNPEWPDYDWTVVSSLPDGQAGSAAFAINERTGSCAPGGDISGNFTLDSPTITLPAGAQSLFIRFDHYVETELNFDGGNVLISVNGGPFELVPQSAYTFNAPPSQLDDPPPLGQNTNPKAGEFAWHGTNEGEAKGSWGTTIIDLNSIAQAGDTIKIRFDFGIDGCNGVTGWYVDEVRVYNCPGGAPLPKAAPTQNDIQDDATPDQVDGEDKDGNYKLSWSYPSPPVEQPCGFQIEEATAFGTAFSDDAEELLVAGSNSKWTGNPQWVSMSHPDTGSNGYSVVYIDNLNTSLTMANAVAIPAGSSALLTFASFEDIEPDFDFGFVEVSGNGGPFQTLAQYTGAFSGQRSVDLSGFAGQSVKVRFRFTSDIVFSFPLFLGWFIDDIKIATANFTPIATVGGNTFSYDVTGRGNGTYAYRIVGIFGSCPGGMLGPYSNTEQITVELGPQTFPPTASFTASPNPAMVNQPVAFNGSASHDNDAVGPSPEIVQYFWAFGDGSTQTTNAPTTSHPYSAPGTYRATLTVTDNDGETASTERMIEVTQAPEPGTQEVTGGGWIPVGGDKGNFGFNAKRKSGQVSGHLNYHEGKMKVQSEGITSLSITGNRATFSGPCKVNKASGFSCTIDVIDNGEPGSSDFFRIRISDGYDRSGTLGGGNIKIQK